jgi:hypothetical protein
MAAGSVVVATGVTGSVQDPWAQFYAGGEIVSAAAAKDVAGLVAQQLKHVSCLWQCSPFLLLLVLYIYFFFNDFEFDGGWCQATAFAERIASGALTSEFAAKRRRLEGRNERLRTLLTKAVQDKSATKSKSHNLMDKLSAAEAEKEELGRRLAAKKEDTDKACAEAQAARAESKLARAEASLALQRAAEVEANHRSLRGHLDKAEASTRTGVDWARALLVDTYQQHGACTTPFDASSKEVGLCFLGWLQEELEVLPSIVTSLMSFASLITCEGAANALPVKDAGTLKSSIDPMKTLATRSSRLKMRC